METPQIIYIQGNGHSGSTLLSMVMELDARTFNAGELSFIIRKGIENEFCSCGDKIGQCPFWNEVLDKWKQRTNASIIELRTLRNRYERNLTTLRLYFAMFSNSQSLRRYNFLIGILFESIAQVSGKNIIIDASKSPQRALILSRFKNIRVLHLIRDFKGVLNSAKKSWTRDLEKGYEEDKQPRKTYRVLLDWLFINSLGSLHRLLYPSVWLTYRDFIQFNSKVLNERLEPQLYIKELRPMSSEHMIAGNALRLEKNVMLNSETGFKYENLTQGQLRIARSVDKIFSIWLANES